MHNFFKNLIYSGLSFFDFKGIIILMYHSIDWNNEFFTVTPEDFKKQMRFLKENSYEVVSLNDLEKRLSNPRSGKTVIITFDDGFRDNYLNAYPILKENNFPAAIFVTSDLIGSQARGRNKNYLAMMDIEEMREMICSGLITIGSHARAHKKLTELPPEQIDDQLKFSKSMLETSLNRKIEFFAYPYGEYNDLVKSIARKYYKFGFSVTRGRITGCADWMALPRNSIDQEVSFTRFRGTIAYGRITWSSIKRDGEYGNKYTITK